LYFSANPNGEAELVTVLLRQSGSIKKLKFDVDFSDMIVKGRASRGNIVTKYSVKRIELKEKGLSTLKPRKIWFDETVQRLNVDQRGELLGDFTSDDRLLVIDQKGIVKTVVPEMTLHFNDEMIVLEKWEPKKPITVIYWEGEKELFYVKRFLIDSPDKEELVITDHPKSYLETVFTDHRPVVELVFTKKRGKEREENSEINLEEFISIKGITALGNQLTKDKIIEINTKEPLFYESPDQTPIEDMEVVEEETVLAETKIDELPLEQDSNTEISDAKKEELNDKAPDPETDGKGQIFLF
jgi:topoisomerase-4 subunit A